jgi:GT2 family glycosyltransferase/glycosyltransferase involved in cell wall biosynthesis
MIPLGKRLVVVLGMHRSGTSAITRALEVLGVDIGANLLPSIDGINAKGFFEDVEINSLNVEILRALGNDWHSLAKIDPEDIKVLNKGEYFLRATDLLRRKTAGAPIFGFKDPRVAKILPFWRHVFSHCQFSADYVLAVRNPLSVVRSLAKRDGLLPEKTYLLWCGHVLNSLAHTEDARRVLVDYDRFVQEPKECLEMIADRLDLKFDRQAFQIYRSEFLDERLRHTMFKSSDLTLDLACPPLAQEVYSDLLGACIDNNQLDKPAFRKRTSRWINEFNRLDIPLRLVDELSRSVDANKVKITDLVISALKQDPNAFQESFDSGWYLEKYRDVAEAGVDPYQHFITFGAKEGRVPSHDVAKCVRDGLSDRLKELSARIGREELLSQGRLLELAEKDNKHLGQLQEILRAHEQQTEDLTRQHAVREDASRLELADARRKIEGYLLELARHEEAHSDRLRLAEQAHEHQKEELIRRHAACERVQLAELADARGQIERQLIEAAERERVHAEENRRAEQARENERDELIRRHADREQAHLAELADARRQIEKHLVEVAERERAHSEQIRLAEQAGEHQREEHFAAHLTRIRADAESAREAESQLVLQQQQSNLREFRRREMDLSHVIADLKQRLSEIETSWLWRLRSVFVPTKSSVFLAAENPSDFDSADNFGDLDMMQSANAWDNQVPTSLSNLLTYEDQEFVDLAYRAILGRTADSIGLAHYVDMLRHGVAKMDIVRILRVSDEGRAYESRLIGLNSSLMYLSWRRLPLLAHFWRPRELSRNLLRQMKVARAEIVELRHKYAGSQSELQKFTEFDPESYQSINDDVASAAINPYEHYIRFGYRENRHTRLPKAQNLIPLACDWLVAGRPPTLPSIHPSVDIIIPIFNGYDFLGPLFGTVAANTRAPYRLIVIDDCSTDLRISGFLQELSERNPGIVLLRNPTNQGFIASVNRGMEQVSSEFFVLLNSDTEVPARWLERLIHPLQTSESIATVTPFSNAATICSFPKSPADNPLYLGLSVDQIDEAFADVGSSAQPIEIPTGVGFCMAMRKSVVEKLGSFDPIYGRGYAEENDWCLRASAGGYGHVLAVNLFVYHKHGGSFPSEERARLIRNNLSTLSTRYPNYFDLVQAHIHADPAKAIRDLVKLRLHSDVSGGATIIIDHDLGGGANAFRNGLIEAGNRFGRSTIVVIDDAQLSGRVLVLAHGPDGETRFSFPSIEVIVEFLKSVSVSEFVYNNLVGSADPLKVIRLLRMQIEARSVPLRIMVHDFYPLCPSYTLINKDGSYCGVPIDLGTCAACMHGYSRDLLPHGPTNMDIRAWRSEWRELMRLATEIRCFSTSSLDIFVRAYPDLANKCTVVPHVVDFKPTRLPTIRPDHRLHIGVVGGINYSKGRAVIEALVRHIEDRGLDHKVSVVGQVDVPIRGIKVTGKYEVTRLPEIIENLGINVILVPSIWPETFSYVTSEMVLLGMPVACFNIGAPAERIRSYEKGIVLEGSDPETILKGLLELGSASEVLHQRHGVEKR